MASTFQRRKITNVFRAMDLDNDGYLTESDFAALTTRWTTILGASPGSADHTRVQAIMMGWWTTLHAASDGDDRVTVEEVLAVVDHLSTMTEAVTATAHTLFDATDHNGDNAITAAEYRTLVEGWNGSQADVDEVFPLLDLDGDGTISRDEFTEHWIEFWSGDNPDAPGTWVFGRFD
ncbi:calcium binding protein [Alloactinosynnema sp. L-07]|uniref:EF-hand domain-containing protein n=1 Tax=Alloactinosynnema sp. L-07 TaxID=1653480 RepID=UPI00065EF588|nr:EF-hand domain-containing protein [Alloactinosynnema sp. L-07]CRK62231.1 calcium binding protein [Alloactinosynnema sp. L-07]